jgi:hypothetical protein
LKIIWRRKEETDISRGTDKLSRIVSSRVSDEEFEQISKEVGVASHEDAYYYKMMLQSPNKDNPPFIFHRDSLDVYFNFNDKIAFAIHMYV